MRSRIIAVACTTAFLSACAPYEGSYSPGCIAYEGNNIVLSDGRFAWRKFTDQVLVGDNGEVINQFPGYPMQGSFRIDGQLVYLKSDAGESLPNMYFEQRNGNHYLLTSEQFADLEKSGTYSDCALMLDENPVD